MDGSATEAQKSVLFLREPESLDETCGESSCGFSVINFFLSRTAALQEWKKSEKNLKIYSNFPSKQNDNMLTVENEKKISVLHSDFKSF